MYYLLSQTRSVSFSDVIKHSFVIGNWNKTLSEEEMNL